MMAANPRLRYLYVVWSVLECFFFGGLLYGWGSLVFVLKEDGVYAELCTGHGESDKSSVVNHTLVYDSSTISAVNFSVYSDIVSGDPSVTVPVQGETIRKNENCADWDRRLSLVFTIGSTLFCVGCAVMGQINYKFGTRAARLCAFVCLTIGGLFTAFTTPDIPWLIFPGMGLLGVGGIPILVTNMQFSVLFNKGSSTVVSLMSGFFDASSGVMLIAKLAHEAGFALQWFMLAITGAHAVTLVNTFFFLPRGFILKSPTQEMEIDATSQEVGTELIEKTNVSSDDKNDIENGALNHEATKSTELPSLKSCVTSPLYYLHVFWLSVLQLRFYYFLGSLNAWLNSLFDTKEEVSYYTNVCLYAMMFGVITSPLAGIIYDFHKHIFAKSCSKVRRDLMPAVIPLALTSLMGLILTILVMFNNASVLYFIFILNTVFRSFMYSMAAAYIGVIFASEHFAVLYGLMIIISGVIGFLQFGLFSWAEASGFISVDGFLIALMVVSLVHPAYQWLSCRRAESKALIIEEK